MYCPNCGSQNQTGTKFCKRCGTNLATVSQALSGKLVEVAPSAEFTKLLKEFYSGRRKAVFGGTLLAGGFMIMTLLVLVGMPLMGAFWIVFWMYVWGVIEVAVGLSRWQAAGGEMRALGYDALGGALPPGSRDTIPPVPPVSEFPAEYPTGPVGVPGSVTEQTTRKLEDREASPFENQSNQAR